MINVKDDFYESNVSENNVDIFEDQSKLNGKAAIRLKPGISTGHYFGKNGPLCYEKLTGLFLTINTSEFPHKKFCKKCNSIKNLMSTLGG